MISPFGRWNSIFGCMCLIISVSSPLLFEKKNNCPNFQILVLFKEGMMAPKLLPVNNRYQTVIPLERKTQVVNHVRFVPWVNVVMWTVQLIDRNIQKYVKLWKRRCYVTACNLAVSKSGARGRAGGGLGTKFRWTFKESCYWMGDDEVDGWYFRSFLLRISRTTLWFVQVYVCI